MTKSLALKAAMALRISGESLVDASGWMLPGSAGPAFTQSEPKISSQVKVVVVQA